MDRPPVTPIPVAGPGPRPRGRAAAGAGGPELATTVLPLTGRGPARARGLIEFLAARAVPGLESTDGYVFRRNVPGGIVELRAGGEPRGDWLEFEHRPHPGHPARTPPELGRLVALVRRLADLDTDLDVIAGHLGADPILAPRVAAVGISRRPGAFDPFELAVRAVVGQQVSVAAARTLLGRLVRIAAGADPVDSFPDADAVAAVSLDDLGMPARRRATITALARAVADGQVDLGTAEGDRLRHQLLALPGIGPWTAGYIAMRLGTDGDGWPSGDLVLRQSLDVTAAELERMSQAWRPWRAYAALVLWQTAGHRS